MPKWAFGKLENGGIRICECGEITLEDEMHVCKLEDKVPDEKSPHHLVTNIEDKTANMDIGKMGYQIIQGVIEEGGTFQDGIQILMAYYAGMFTGAVEQNRREDDEEGDGHGN